MSRGEMQAMILWDSEKTLVIFVRYERMVAIAEVLGNRQGNERSVPCCEQVVSIETEIKCISHNVIKHNCHGIEFHLKLVELKGSSWLEMIKKNTKETKCATER
jgi:hypothetical protein